ncbi:hypothetical protein ACFL59_03135 [Planctomycetota bacterium]
MGDDNDSSMNPILVGVALALLLLLLGGGLFLRFQMGAHHSTSVHRTARIHVAKRDGEAEARRIESLVAAETATSTIATGTLPLTPEQEAERVEDAGEGK